jgi:hypothetical protein
MANESTAFGEWWSKKGSEWSSKASEIINKIPLVGEVWETEEEEKEAAKEFQTKVTEEADKTIDTEYKELSKDEQEAYDLKRVKIFEQMKAEEEKQEAEADKDLQKRLEGIQKVINTFENFQAGESGGQIAGYEDVGDPYAGTSALSDLKEKENLKSLLSQITGYTNPMSRAVDLEKRMQNLVKYT